MLEWENALTSLSMDTIAVKGNYFNSLSSLSVIFISPSFLLSPVYTVFLVEDVIAIVCEETVNQTSTAEQSSSLWSQWLVLKVTFVNKVTYKIEFVFTWCSSTWILSFIVAPPVLVFSFPLRQTFWKGWVFQWERLMCVVRLVLPRVSDRNFMNQRGPNTPALEYGLWLFFNIFRKITQLILSFFLVH